MNKSLYLLLVFFLIAAPMAMMQAQDQPDDSAIPSPNEAIKSDIQTLEECITHAIANRPDIRLSRISLEKAEWRVLAEKAKYAFDLTVSSARDLEDDTNANAFTLNRTFPMDFNVRATLTQNDSGNEGTAWLRISKVILGGGSLEESNKEIQDSLINEVTAKNNHFQKIRQLNLQITKAYYNVVRSKQTLDIQKRQLERAKTNLERAVERDLLLDIANANVQVSENEDRVLQAGLDIQSAKDNLKREIGMPVNGEISVTERFTLEMEKQNLDLDWQFTQENHVDFINYYLKLKKVDRDLRIEHSQLWPTVSMEYVLSKDSVEEFDLEGDTASSIGVSLNWQFGAAEDRSAYHIALLSKQEADIELFDITQRKLLELRNQGRQLDELTQRIALSEERLKLQERSTALYADRWENGEIDILEYIRNQDSLENSRVDLLRLKIEYIEKIAEYHFSVGR